MFIPIKPSKKIRVGDYLTKSYLIHNAISGLEGNLKRSDISDETRSKILKKFTKLEKYLPTANGYEYERINSKEKDLIIKRIMTMKRKI